MTPTLFVISFRNYNSPDGMRMNNEAYTSYPGENEILLREGCEVFVLDIEDGVEIINPFPSFKKFNGKVFTIVYLYQGI